MKDDRLLARFLAMIAIVALLSAGCAPIPVNLPRTLSPTTEVFLPGVGAPSINTSPLQPTAVPTGAEPVAATPSPEATLPLPTSTPAPTLVGPVWQWVSSTFKDGTVLAPGDPTRYTFQLLGDGNALVQADCNFGTGAYEASGNSISFDAIGTTKMACPPDSLDSAFLAQLSNAAAFTVEGDQGVITLKDAAGAMRLRAVPGEAAEATPTLPPLASPTAVPTDTPWPTVEALPTAPPTPTVIPPTSPTPLPVSPTPVLLGTAVPLPTAVLTTSVRPGLDGTEWVLVSLTANGQGIPPVGTTPVTLAVDPDGARVSGSTGCNQYRATLRQDEAGIAIVGPALMTQKACAANLMVQEVEFIDSLLRARSYLLRGSELTLLDATAKPVLVLVRK